MYAPQYYSQREGLQRSPNIFCEWDANAGAYSLPFFLFLYPSSIFGLSWSLFHQHSADLGHEYGWQSSLLKSFDAWLPAAL